MASRSAGLTGRVRMGAGAWDSEVGAADWDPVIGAGVLSGGRAGLAAGGTGDAAPRVTAGAVAGETAGAVAGRATGVVALRVAAGGGLAGADLAADGTGLVGALGAAGRATVLRVGVVFLVTGAGGLVLVVPVVVPVVLLLEAPDAVLAAAGAFFVVVFLVMIGFSSAMAEHTPPQAGYTGLMPSLSTAC
ncbi:MAG TPA: hypothetical protein PLY96_01440 [Chromatiaceae bacterium]|nr:hypothetical protein [Chromatiaceae bacterium]